MWLNTTKWLLLTVGTFLMTKELSYAVYDSALARADLRRLKRS